MKIGIITFHNAINYGAILQCYALQSFIEQECKKNVEIINYTPNYFKQVFYNPGKPLSALGYKQKIKALIKYFIKHEEIIRQSRKNYELNRFIHNKLHLTKEMIKPTEDDFDVIIAGSDQIWNLELLNNDTTYLLDFVHSKKRVSYAASFKISDIDKFGVEAYKKYLSQFENISVRESNLQDYLKKEYGISSKNVLDPTLLVSKDLWIELIDNSRLIKEDYILIYYVNKPVKLLDKAIEYAKNNSLKVVSLNSIKITNNYINYSNASVEEFLNLIKNAKQVFTTSFHGMAFSIIFHKDFYFEVPRNSYNNNDRLLDLSDKLNLSKRNISQEFVNDNIDWIDVEKHLNKLKIESAEYLFHSLKEEFV